ncbi:TetR/AcrR family transcriptional regulator [Mycobacterium sp.]|uniref:TetR/AcrR family transcriptional regulator n=1 Tax=Mycobacterium sp. TaxID=1785 RepID=UPI0012798447|nr:TetR/AcrR family transcriptional regulator [Mycobacterium sp.]KAA8968959.1 MAG: TetR/AcrR family transcriptional regulator [Mycobacterium sp.]
MPHPASRGPGRPPAAKAADTRKRITLAAREVFSERGYDATTFQEIALRADLTRPAINHYFPSKRALFREVVRQTTELIVNTGIARAQHETTLGGRVSALLAAAIDTDGENSSATRFLVTSVLEIQRHRELDYDDAIGPIRTFLAGSVAAAVERGELSADTDAASLTELLLAVLYGVVFYAGFADNAHTMAAIATQLRRLLAGILVR